MTPRAGESLDDESSQKYRMKIQAMSVSYYPRRSEHPLMFTRKDTLSDILQGVTVAIVERNYNPARGDARYEYGFGVCVTPCSCTQAI